MENIKLRHGMWVLVADGEKALFLRNQGDAQYPNLEVVRELHEENPPTREQGTDRPGRFNDGPTVHRSAVADMDRQGLARPRDDHDQGGREVPRTQPATLRRGGDQVSDGVDPISDELVRREIERSPEMSLRRE